MDKTARNNDRRTFLRGAAAVGGLMVVPAGAARSSAANSKIEIGVIGCGGRGRFVTQNFFEHAEGEFHIAAIQDPFGDRLQTMKDRYYIEDAKTFEGLQTDQDLLEMPLDAVIITSPPYFHPDQVERAVESGKHIWLAKPVAVDVPGCQRILHSAKRCEGQLTFLVDFQTRNSPNFKECVSRVHQGAIGDLVLGHVYYHAGRLGVQKAPENTFDAHRLRNWVFDIKLSGDIIVEQNVHVLDVANWYTQSHPIEAVGSGGRMARTDVGDCYDHFVVSYIYPGGVKIDFSSAQFTKGYTDLCIRMYGAKGTADSHYNGAVKITGENPWDGVEHDDTWGCVKNNVTDFVRSIREGEAINHGEYSVNSTLTGVLGRTAAYERDHVTWDEMMAKADEFHVDLKI